jgi:glycosyltransferase involved in cell wall biosynthesis
MAKRVLFNAASGFIAIGTRNQEFYLWNGVQKDRIYFAPFSVDNRFFFTSEAQRPALRSHTRAALGIDPDDCVLLSSSKLIPIKQVKDLVIACAQLAPRCPSLRLLIVGSGEQEQSLRDLAEQLGFSKVTFAGFRNQSELPGIYAASDIFGLASRVEPWGLAVNEAMASGLPCIVSDRVGCAVDLVSEKGTGEVYPCGDLGKLMQAIARYAEDSAERKAASERALALIAHWDNSVCADKMIEACRAVAA